MSKLNNVNHLYSPVKEKHFKAASAIKALKVSLLHLPIISISSDQILVTDHCDGAFVDVVSIKT